MNTVSNLEWRISAEIMRLEGQRGSRQTVQLLRDLHKELVGAGIDTDSPASRQHYIYTGRFLKDGGGRAMNSQQAAAALAEAVHGALDTAEKLEIGDTMFRSSFISRASLERLAAALDAYDERVAFEAGTPDPFEAAAQRAGVSLLLRLVVETAT